MIAALRTALADLLDPRPARCDLHKRVGRLDSRVALLAADLDCDAEGSLASDVGHLSTEIADLRARLDEWEPAVARDAARREGAR